MKPVVGHENYAVTSDGEVYSIPRLDSLGRQVGGKFLSQVVCKRGYRYVKVDGIKRTVHSLVLEAWDCPRPDGAVALHRNDIPDDNRIENLSWGSHRMNAEDRKRNGGYARNLACVNGHLYTPENTWLTREGYQQCRECHRKRSRDAKRERKAL